MTRRRPRPLTRRPAVTVVVPCYNYGRYVGTAVRSALEQPGVDVEVIVIDDASPDGSAGVVRELAAGDRRVRAILHEHNRGHIATYNEGLAQAAGDYVVLLSADDALTPGALSRATALMEANPSVSFAYGFPLEVEFDEQPPPVSDRVRSWSVWQGQDWIERACRTGRNFILSPEVVMRNSIQHEIGGVDPALPHSGDMDQWLRAAALGAVGRVNGPPQAYYRVHRQAMHMTRFAGWVVDLEARLATFEKVLLSPDSRVQRGEELFATARAALARCAVQYARVALERSQDELEPVGDYLAFAQRVWPAVTHTPAWSAVQRRRSGRRRPVQMPSAFAIVDGFRSRAAWRRWRWSGVW